MTKAELDSFLESQESSIRQGQPQKVIESLKGFSRNHVPFEYLHKFANLGRRVRDFNYALRLLNPQIRETGLATDAQKLEYAASLTSIGCSSEAESILLEIPKDKNIERNLFLAFSKFTRWEYQDAIPLLIEYIDKVDNDYMKIVGKLNLAAAYVTSFLPDQAHLLLTHLEQETKEKGLVLLQGNCLELLAQNSIIQRNYDNAETYLTKSKKLLKHSSFVMRLWVTKWRGLNQALNGDRNQALKLLSRSKKMAQSIHHFETIRECQYFSALISNNTKKYLDVFHGTPWSGYKKRMNQFSQLFWRSPPLPYNHLLVLGASSLEKVHLQLELPSGGCSTIERLLLSLFSDLYKPHSAVRLFTNLYPDQHYNPRSSAHLIHSQIYKLRSYVLEKKLPLQITSKNEGYTIHPTQAFVFQPNPPVTLKPRVDRIKRNWANSCFKAWELAKLEGISDRAAQIWLKEQTELGQILKIKKTRPFLYKLAQL